MEIYQSVHLPREKQIELGSYYTPKFLVDEVYNLISRFIKSKNGVVILDSAAGCGAFIADINKYDYRVADYDKKAFSFLKSVIFNCSN